MARKEGTARGFSVALGLVVASVMAGTVIQAEAGPGSDQGGAVRASDDSSQRLIRMSVAASPTVAALVDALAGTDVVVYVQLGLTPRNVPGDLRLVGATADCRYVVIRVSVLLSPVDRIALLGHELQHAKEVADAAEVHDEVGLAHLMARIGWQKSRGRFETDAAARVTRQVRNEAEDSGWR